jgi:hypothetical protein
MRYTLVLTIALMLSLPSCEMTGPTYDEQFGLSRFRVEHFDTYNPILNRFRLDPAERAEHPQYYDYDAYFDDAGELRYAFFRSGSYGYLQDFHYDDQGRLSRVEIYPILGDRVDRPMEVESRKYCYRGDELLLVRDTLNDEIFFLDGDSATVYIGVLGTGISEFHVERISVSEFFVDLLH